MLGILALFRNEFSNFAPSCKTFQGMREASLLYNIRSYLTIFLSRVIHECGNPFGVRFPVTILIGSCAHAAWEVDAEEADARPTSGGQCAVWYVGIVSGYLLLDFGVTVASSRRRFHSSC